MNKLKSAGLCLLLASAATSLADVTVVLPKGSKIKQLPMASCTVQNLVESKGKSDISFVKSNLDFNKGVAVINSDNEPPTRYVIKVSDEVGLDVYASPGENITVNIEKIKPFSYKVSGSKLMEGIAEIDSQTMPILEKQMKLQANGAVFDREAMVALYNDYITVLTDFIEENPTNPAVAYAMLYLDEDSFMKYYPRLSEAVKASALFPCVEQQKLSIDEEVAKERKLEEMQSGNVEAPEFTLTDVDGKPVRLSQFRGKWVILDFWGSWCIWCVRGFPELKEAYAKYAGKLEIIGLDCNESKEDWLAGVKKYELPWVNLYCPEGNPLFEQYGIQGFPTKAIIDPEGKIRNITVGHNPDFFKILSELID